MPNVDLSFTVVSVKGLVIAIFWAINEPIELPIVLIVVDTTFFKALEVAAVFSLLESVALESVTTPDCDVEASLILILLPVSTNGEVTL